MHLNMLLLTDLSYQLGVIGLAEYRERLQIVDWLDPAGEDRPDPRGLPEDYRPPDAAPEGADERSGDASGLSNNEIPQDRLTFTALGKWVFTLGDVDCYPSVPHGHLYRKTNAWPKLNPYTGNAFSGMHQQEYRLRLNRDEMRNLWSNDKFVEHCREQVLWYNEFEPRYGFPGARRGILRFPSWK